MRRLWSLNLDFLAFGCCFKMLGIGNVMMRIGIQSRLYRFQIWFEIETQTCTNEIQSTIRFDPNLC